MVGARQHKYLLHKDGIYIFFQMQIVYVHVTIVTFIKELSAFKDKMWSLNDGLACIFLGDGVVFGDFPPHPHQ